MVNSYATRYFSFCSLIWQFCNTTDTRKDFNGNYCNVRAGLGLGALQAFFLAIFFLDHIKIASCISTSEEGTCFPYYIGQLIDIKYKFFAKATY